MNSVAAPQDPTTSAPPRPQISLLLTAVFLIYLGQMTLNPIIAPLSREVGLAEWQIGLTISTAAIVLVLSSQSWGRRSQSWGRKPVLVAAFTLATLTMALFALVSQLGMSGILTGAGLFVLFLLLRGIGFGAAIAAVPPTAQAYIADVTDDEPTRVRGMAGIGAASGVAMIGGAVVGGVLSAGGLIVPLLAVPVLLGAGLILLALRLRREPRHELVAQPARISPLDARVWPFLLAGFGMFTALGFIQVITGFIVQDRLGLDARMTGVLTGAALFLAGIGLVIAQAVIVPRSGWSAPTLLKVGAPVAVLGFAAYAIDGGPVLMLAALLVMGLGLGIAMPGYTAGPTLLVSREEQGGLAGLTTATMGLTFVVAPTLSTALYGVWAPLSILIGGAIMALVAVFVLLHPRFRRMPEVPVGAAPGSLPPTR